GILLPDRQNHIVAGNHDLTDHALALDPAAFDVVLHLLEAHAGEPSVLNHEGLGRVIHDDLDALLLRIVQLPGRGFEEAARLKRHHLDILGPESQRAATAVHRRVTDTNNEDALTNRIDVAKSDRLEPGDADVDAVGLVPARQLQLLTLGSPRADKD